ncbi:uncharacterized protein [Prorops nasuta]|uniref:uncharacterized protein n=1 Tax=Prorops nasuta TaxID=863751 RepID=UPI0034CDB5EB
MEAVLPADFSLVHGYESVRGRSADDLRRAGQRWIANFAQESRHDHYMVPTRSPRELNQRILSLFNPQFLPNFNDMVMHVATHCDSSSAPPPPPPPPRSRSLAEEERFYTYDNAQRKRTATNSMLLQRNLPYEPSHN